ncbi:hypothetical protein SAMN04515667_2112 [Formosa sp. Hel1_31_208]|nr:hypothetical protein SAMN04515667_2112 [Formosa sp. Hel1_31_208]
MVAFVCSYSWHVLLTSMTRLVTENQPEESLVVDELASSVALIAFHNFNFTSN